MVATTNSTKVLASFVANIGYDDLPTGVVRQTSRFLLDAVGCAIAAWREDKRKAEIAQRAVDDFGARGTASIIGGGMSHPALAAFANGILINAADNDDTHKRALAHIGSVVVPAALAVTEGRGGSGRELIEALVAGYEVTARVGMSVMPTHYRFWHSTATNGTFGAAAAAGRAMGLGEAAMAAALGMAGTQAAGLNTFFESGDDTKSLHPGKAGLNGVLSALLAEFGATSPPDILGHPKGYLAAFSQEPRPEELVRGLGSTWCIMDNGFKFFPSILASHSPIGATLKIVVAHSPDVSRISNVAVNTYSTVKSHFSNKNVSTTMGARLSVPYCVAVALVDGKVTQEQFGPARFNDPLVQDLLSRVEIVSDPELSPLYPEKFPARVKVTMQDGSVYTDEMYYPKGDPNNPLSDDELREKFRSNAEGFANVTDIELLMGMIENLSDLKDVSDLASRLRGSGQHSGNGKNRDC